MSPSHATKGGRRWRYYVSQAVLQGRKQDAGSVARVEAMEIERRVCEAVRAVVSASDRQHSISSQSGQRYTSCGLKSHGGKRSESASTRLRVHALVERPEKCSTYTRPCA